MRDPDETIQAIEEAVEDYVTWSGLSADAAHWSAEHADRPDEPDRPRFGDFRGVTPTMTIVDEVHDWPSVPLSAIRVPPTEFEAGMAWVVSASGEWVPVGTASADGLEFGPTEVVSMGFDGSRDSATVTMSVDVSGFTQALGQVGESFRLLASAMKGAADRTHPAIAPRIYGNQYRKHRRTCRLCNPNAGPPPLRINGAEYARRRKARTRRNRR
jgi:hypothetical protein